MQGGLILSTFCDMDCIFCEGIPQKISAEKVKDIEKLVAKNIEYYLENTNVDSIELSGADPGEYQYIVELVAYLKKKGFKRVRLSTNGIRISRDNLLERLYDAGLDEIKVPLYGETEEVFERVARRKNSFNYVLDSIRNFKGDVIVNIGVTQQNKNHLKNIISKAFETNSKIKIFVHSIVVADNNFSYYVPDYEFKKILPDIYRWIAKEKLNVFFTEFPMCVFGEIMPNSLRGSPPKQGIQQPKEILKSELEDVPSYRIKDKKDFCNNCLAFNRCDGFNRNGFNKFGPGDLAPILKEKNDTN